MTSSTSDSDAGSDETGPREEGAPGHSRRSREQKKALQRQKILDAARDVFFRDGFVDANLDEVAQIANVAKGTLYRYFENKGELYVAVLSDNGELFEQRMREAAARGADPFARIREVGRFYFEHWTRNREYFQIFWALENQSVIGELPGAVVEEVTKLWDRCLHVLSGVIEAGVESGDFAPCDAWIMAHLMWTNANGLIQSEWVESRRRLRERDLEAVYSEMVELFLRGLASPGVRRA